MFQFPGFASLTLCIQVKDTCLTRLLSTPEGNNNQVSGGLPHSEIHGSKPVPGSPWLIAGYHVLHRLLLPRHPPNALIALDSTRKEQGRAPFVKRRPHSGRKLVHSHAISSDTAVSCTRLGTVSCLHPSRRTDARFTPHSGRPARNRCVSLSTMSSEAAEPLHASIGRPGPRHARPG